MKLKSPGEYGGQCGKYANVVFDNYSKGKHFGDTLAQKKTFINSQTPVPGAMIIVNSFSAYGHIAIVKDVYNDGTILVNDSNSKHTEIVNEYILDPKNQERPRGKGEIEGYYIPYTHFFHVVIDRDGNAKILRDTESGETPTIGLIGNHGKPPTDIQLAKARATVKTIGLPAYEKQDEYCTTNFNTGMMKEKSKALTLPPVKTSSGVLSERMYFSYYNVGDVSQNDGDPCSAAGSHIVGNVCDIANKGIRAMALVNIKRNQYNAHFGDTVVLKGDKGCAGSFLVTDEMNKRFRQPDDVCVKKPGTNLCIRGDIAMPLGVAGGGGSCYISEVIKK